MSILLEALRKSEKKQRPHETPTIHTEVQNGAAAGSLRAVPLSLLLIAALLLSGWLVWRQYRAPEGSYQPPVTLSADKVQKTPRPVAADQAAAAGTDKQAVQKGKPQKRTPVETYEPPVQSGQAPEVAKAPPSSGNRPVARPGQTEPETATVEKPSSADRPRAAATPGSNPEAGRTAAVAGKPKPAGENAAAAKEKFHPGKPEPIGYWELPDAIRTEVPEIKFSVLVYAADPADRFVLVNGQRLAEGDSLKPGLVVEEIRRDGVVFSYRLYQFLVER